MNASLTPTLETFIRDRAASGDYNNASEVVREAVRLLQRIEEEQALKLKRLRASVRVGDECFFNTSDESRGCALYVRELAGSRYYIYPPRLKGM